MGDFMNIKNNIVNYLYDKEYLITIYENSIYIFNYKFLNDFTDNKIVLKFDNKIISIFGSKLTIVKLTKEEILIHGNIFKLEVNDE